MSKISYHVGPKEPIDWPSLVSSRHDQSQADSGCNFLPGLGLYDVLIL